MNQEINILITSVGRRTKLIEYFRNELRNIGKLVVTDNSTLAPALYFADKYYLVPKISDPNYINIIKEICLKENITGILSLIDPELSLLSLHINELKKLGVVYVGSPYNECERWFDKYSAAEFCMKNGIKMAKTFNNFTDFESALNSGLVHFPFIIKPRRGSASLNINIVRNIDEATFVYKLNKDVILQEFLFGKELGADVYIDLITRKIVSIFIKEKLLMRSGETDKSKSIKSDKIVEIITDLVQKTSLIGPIDIDIFNVEGEYYISEINPRFGGGYPHAYECNVNFPKLIIKNLQNKINEPNILDYEENVYMMKHDSLEVVKFDSQGRGYTYVKDINN